MAESKAHKRAKAKAAGVSGETEVPISGGMRLDAATQKRAIEIERNGRLDEAARRLRGSGKPQKVLQVPQTDMDAAVKAMKRAGVKGTIKNLGGTKRKSVR